jgi:hypothetical protein
MMCVADSSAPHYFRAQNMFRQAMRSPVILFQVVPASMKTQYKHFSQGNSALCVPGGRAVTGETLAQSWSQTPRPSSLETGVVWWSSGGWGWITPHRGCPPGQNRTPFPTPTTMTMVHHHSWYQTTATPHLYPTVVI